MEALLNEHMPKFLESLTSKCLSDTKFLCGVTLTIYDFQVAGLFTNVILNPNSRFDERVANLYHAKAPEKLKKYISDFQEEMKEYLDKRAKDHDCTF